MCRALKLELPTVSLRSVLVRLTSTAITTVLSQPRPVRAQRGQARGGSAPAHAQAGTGSASGGARASQPLTTMRQHPTMKKVLALAEVVMLLHLHEGRSSRTVAGE